MNCIWPDNLRPRPLGPFRTIIHKFFRLAFLIYPNGIARIPQRSTTTRVPTGDEPLKFYLEWFFTEKILRSNFIVERGTFYKEIEASPISSAMILRVADKHEKIHSSSNAEWPEVSF
ncbi:hypothetical protein BTUL_0077g00380 [Botrytis tulipae]|uniref:Uncharacterized protein n=1 Tax=Botrytis tulipae TaxID=87230 RepID=A0A4Z1EL43_9HELO|nr:hypothetical protein BTUL_0077g00380 [Botrytis tulipae]